MLRSSSPRLPRLARLGLPVVAVLALSGCGEASAPAPSEPSGSPTPSTMVAPASGTAGSDGMTVRYLGDDGKVQTLPVEDFPR